MEGKEPEEFSNKKPEILYLFKSQKIPLSVFGYKIFFDKKRAKFVKTGHKSVASLTVMRKRPIPIVARNVVHVSKIQDGGKVTLVIELTDHLI